MREIATENQRGSILFQVQIPELFENPELVEQQIAGKAEEFPTVMIKLEGSELLNYELTFLSDLKQKLSDQGGQLVLITAVPTILDAISTNGETSFEVFQTYREALNWLFGHND